MPLKHLSKRKNFVWNGEILYAPDGSILWHSLKVPKRFFEMQTQARLEALNGKMPAKKLLYSQKRVGRLPLFDAFGKPIIKHVILASPEEFKQRIQEFTNARIMQEFDADKKRKKNILIEMRKTLLSARQSVLQQISKKTPETNQELWKFAEELGEKIEILKEQGNELMEDSLSAETQERLRVWEQAQRELMHKTKGGSRIHKP